MSDPEPRSGVEIERLVLRSLDRRSERIDPRPLLTRILDDLDDSKSRPTPTLVRRSVRWSWGVVGIGSIAATILIACLPVFRRERVVLARGETVVREARQAHLSPVDRCYLVEVRRESSKAAELAPNTPQVRLTRLWTRGDRFWVESARADQSWAWGRDSSNRFWIAFGPHTAVRMEANEVPEWLNLYCDLHSLNVEEWLGDVLKRFDLTRETSPSSSEDSTIRVTARAREIPAPVPTIDSAEIEIDAESRVIRRLVVRRVWNGEPFATVTYSLLETDAIDPAKYQIEGHLSDPSEIFTRDQNYVNGYNNGMVMEYVLKAAGDDLSPANIMKQALSIKDLELPMLLPGIKVNTSATDNLPVEQLQFMRFNGKQWERFGDVMTAK